MPFRLIDKGIWDYAEKFWKLDSTDFAILKAINVHGPRNLSRVAQELGLSPAVVNYRAKRMFDGDLVKVFAVIDEEALGLESVWAFATVPFGREAVAFKALTIYPLWRFSCLTEGAFHGAAVRYAVPKGSTPDLHAYLSHLKYRGVIESFELREAEQYIVPFPNLDFYLESTGPFDWNRWAEEVAEGRFRIHFDREKAGRSKAGKVNFGWLDLYVLFWLQADARMKFAEIARKLVELKGGSVSSWKVKITQTYRKTTRRLVRGYGFYILPVSEHAAVRVLVELSFPNEPRLESFAGGLDKLPYPLAFHPYRGLPGGLLHVIVPLYEYYLMVKALRTLAKKCAVESYRILLPNRGEVWSNFAIYEAFDGEWKFSYELLVDKFKSENL